MKSTTALKKEVLLDYDRVETYLILWAAWYRNCKTRLGYPGASVGFTSGGITCYDDLEHEGDEYVGRTVNALVDDLKPAQSCAVRCIHLGESWRFPRDNMMALYDLACDELERGLNRWGLG